MSSRSDGNIPAHLLDLLGLARTGMGFINGWLVAVEVPPFIAGHMADHPGRQPASFANETIRLSDITRCPALQFGASRSSPAALGILYAVFLLIAMVADAVLCCARPPGDGNVHAVGDDPDAAELAGGRPAALIQVYALAGLFCAIAGWG